MLVANYLSLNPISSTHSGVEPHTAFHKHQLSFRHVPPASKFRCCRYSFPFWNPRSSVRSLSAVRVIFSEFTASFIAVKDRTEKVYWPPAALHPLWQTSEKVIHVIVTASYCCYAFFSQSIVEVGITAYFLRQLFLMAVLTVTLLSTYSGRKTCTRARDREMRLWSDGSTQLVYLSYQCDAT